MVDWFGIVLIVAITCLGLPALILHNITKWKQAKTLTPQDENLLDDLHDMARRLEDRVITVERLIAADNPDWHRINDRTPEPRRTLS